MFVLVTKFMWTREISLKVNVFTFECIYTILTLSKQICLFDQLSVFKFSLF